MLPARSRSGSRKVESHRRRDARSECQLLLQAAPFWPREESQFALFCKAFLRAFQGYDEGSIVFTRSNRCLSALRPGAKRGFAKRGSAAIACASVKAAEDLRLPAPRGMKIKPRRCGACRSVAQWLEHRSPNQTDSLAGSKHILKNWQKSTPLRSIA
jgi:hypothetical protein